jgi:hypothetical protein
MLGASLVSSTTLSARGVFVAMVTPDLDDDDDELDGVAMVVDEGTNVAAVADAALAPTLALASHKAPRSTLFAPIERLTHPSLDAYLLRIKEVSPQRLRVVDDLARIFHSFAVGIPPGCRSSLAKAILEGSPAEVTAAAIVALQHVLRVYFNLLSPAVRAHFSFVFVVEKNSSAAGLKKGSRATINSLEHLVGMAFLTWTQQSAVIAGNRARIVSAGFAAAFDKFSAVATELGVDFTAIVLAGAYEGDQAQLYIALDDGGDGAFSVLVTGDRDVTTAARVFGTNLAASRVLGRTVIIVHHNVDVNVQRYASAARKLTKRLVQVKARLHEAETAQPLVLEAVATVRRFGFCIMFWLGEIFLA